MSSIIEDLIARKIFNSRGEETIEVDVITTGGFGRASAPAGKSRGKAEVVYYEYNTRLLAHAVPDADCFGNVGVISVINEPAQILTIGGVVISGSQASQGSCRNKPFHIGDFLRATDQQPLSTLDGSDELRRIQ